MQKAKKFERASFIPIESLPLIPFYLTSGSWQKISGNLIGLVICDSYLVLVFSPYPVSDLMNYKFKAEWIHFDWFSSQILSFY